VRDHARPDLRAVPFGASTGAFILTGMNLLAEVSHGDLSTVFVLLALVCFGLAVYAAFLRNVLGAVLLAFLGIIILIFGA
jgi:hypothetical protein